MLNEKYIDNLKDLDANNFLTLMDYYAKFPIHHLVRRIIQLENTEVIKDILESFKI